MRIVSWNINSLRKRQDRLFPWLEATKPDIVCLQETKCPDELFPALALQRLSRMIFVRRFAMK
jgi:exodeoxyribonuclease-3